MKRTIYRAMVEDRDGKPKSMRSPNHLGVRVKGDGPFEVHDIEVIDGHVEPTHQGMSVQIDDPRGAPLHRLPRELGGASSGVLYEMHEDELPVELRLEPDRETHGVLRPSRRCTLDEYENALNATRSRWRKSDVTRFQ